MTSAGRLDGWKAIAAHLGRTVRTVQRWEREQGLPLQRQRHNHSDSVFVDIEALEHWLASRITPPLTGPSTQPHEEVQKSYLRARHFWHKRSRTALTRALLEFRRALDIDPLSSVTYSGLAETYLALSLNEFTAPADGYRLAEEAARQALERDPGSACAHSVVGFVAGFLHADWIGATDALDRAVTLDSGWINAYYWRGFIDLNLGQLERALEHLRRAWELAPLSPPTTVKVGHPLLCMGRYSEAIEWFQRARALDPTFWLAPLFLGWASEAQGRHVEARHWFNRAVVLSGHHPATRLSLAHCLVKLGKREAGLELANAVASLGPTQYVSAVRVARVHAALGDKPATLLWLRRAGADNSIRNNVYPRHDYALAAMAGDPVICQAIRDGLRLPDGMYA